MAPTMFVALLLRRAPIEHKNEVPFEIQIKGNEQPEELTGGRDVIALVERRLVPQGANVNRPAGVDVGAAARRATENGQRAEPDALLTHVAARQLPKQTVDAHGGGDDAGGGGGGRESVGISGGKLK